MAKKYHHGTNEVSITRDDWDEIAEQAAQGDEEALAELQETCTATRPSLNCSAT